jgi:hypothetical protein
VLGTSINELNRMSKILIQYETCDASQFQRLLAGEDPDDVFVDQEPRETEAPAEAPRKEPSRPRGLGLPLPGNIASGQPPESPQPS